MSDEKTELTPATAPFEGLVSPDVSPLVKNREVDLADLDLDESDWTPPDNPEGIHCSSCPGGYRSTYNQQIGDGTTHGMPVCSVGGDKFGSPGFISLNDKNPPSFCPYMPTRAEPTIKFLTSDFSEIIDNKLYKTEGSEMITSVDNELRMSDPSYSEELLYRTQKGNYFLVQRGGFLSDFNYCEGKTSYPGKKIVLLNEEELEKWLFARGSVELIRKILGENALVEG